MRSSEFTAGDWVEVRSREEILATLDKNGRLDELPFMPEMFALCGKRLRVFKRAHKTCDPPSGLEGRRMVRAVHLEDVRCDGAAHGGCQAGCLIFWKDAWLKPADHRDSGLRSRPSAGCTEGDVQAGCYRAGHGAGSEAPLYVCQSTQVPLATQPLRPWHLQQYVEDYFSGNVGVAQMIASMFSWACDWLARDGIGLGSVIRSTYDLVQRQRGGTVYPLRSGLIPAGEKTPSSSLNLQSGDLVKVRRYDEILATLDSSYNNRGMCFDAEMVPYCGGTYRVLQRVNRIIDEKSGRLIQLKNDCIQLESVVCLACFAKYRKFCPRTIYPYWREIWLERSSAASDGVS